MFVQSISCVLFFATPWTVARQAPLSVEFSRQEYGNKWVTISYYRGSFQPRDWICISCISTSPGKPSCNVRSRERWQVLADGCQCLENSLNWSLRNILWGSGGLNLGQKVALPPSPWPSLTRMERMSCVWKAEACLPMRRRECGRVGSGTILRASSSPLAMVHASLRASSGSTGCPVFQSNPLLTETWDPEDCTIPATNLGPGPFPSRVPWVCACFLLGGKRGWVLF